MVVKDFRATIRKAKASGWEYISLVVLQIRRACQQKPRNRRACTEKEGPSPSYSSWTGREMESANWPETRAYESRVWCSVYKKEA